MISREEFYSNPSQEIFDDIKQGAIKVWSTYSESSPDYAQEKLSRVERLSNANGDWVVLVQMFDPHNQIRLYNLLERADSRVLVQKMFESYEDLP